MSEHTWGWVSGVGYDLWNGRLRDLYDFSRLSNATCNHLPERQEYKWRYLKATTQNVSCVLTCRSFNTLSHLRHLKIGYNLTTENDRQYVAVLRLTRPDKCLPSSMESLRISDIRGSTLDNIYYYFAKNVSIAAKHSLVYAPPPRPFPFIERA